MTDCCLSCKKIPFTLSLTQSETLRISNTEHFCLQAGTVFLAEGTYSNCLHCDIQDSLTEVVPSSIIVLPNQILHTQG